MTYVFCDEINNILLINLFYILLIFFRRCPLLNSLVNLPIKLLSVNFLTDHKSSLIIILID
jgi:hypothetical protein